VVKKKILKWEGGDRKDKLYIIGAETLTRAKDRIMAKLYWGTLEQNVWSRAPRANVLSIRRKGLPQRRKQGQDYQGKQSEKTLDPEDKKCKEFGRLRPTSSLFRGSGGQSSEEDSRDLKKRKTERKNVYGVRVMQ